MAEPKQADLVLEGGGVKGIALVGAVAALTDAGYRFPRVAGTSAGAIVGALIASDLPTERIRQVMAATDYSKFRDESLLDRFGAVGKGLSLIFEQGIYEGEYLKSYLRELLPDARERFAGMRLPPDPGTSLPPERRYRLVVMVSDVSRQVLARFPWDYPAYGLAPDDQSVVDAVRASMSIPFFFEPAHLDYDATGPDGRRHRRRSTLVDGGMLSNFPIAVFDRSDARPPRWPTFGVKLSGRAEQTPVPAPVSGPLGLARGMLATMTSWYDRAHVEDPDVTERTIFVDTFGISAVDFSLGRDDQQRLYRSGYDAATRFLATWDFAAYLDRRAARARLPAGGVDLRTRTVGVSVPAPRSAPLTE